MPVLFRVFDAVHDDHLILCAGGGHIQDAHFLLQLLAVLFVLDGDAGKRRTLHPALIHVPYADAHVCVKQERLAEVQRGLSVCGPQEDDRELQPLGLMDAHDPDHIVL